MLADDTVICSESRGQVEEHLKKVDAALEERGLKNSRRRNIRL